MSWSNLSNRDVPFHDEVRDAVSTGVLHWDSTEPAWTDGDDHTWTRSDFEQFILHEDMSSSGIGLDDIMFKDEMEQYAAEPVTVPQSFFIDGQFDNTVDCFWDNAGREEQKTLQNSSHGNPSGTWNTVSTSIGATATFFNFSNPLTDANDETFCRIRFNSESEWSPIVSTVMPQ